MGKKILSGLICAGALAGLAGEYVWTGAQDAYWTNAANWTVGGAVAANPPGWVLAKTAGGVLTTNGTPADVAVFGACTSGRTTIDLDGQWKIDSVVFTNEAPAYTLGTSTAKAQFLKLGLKAKVAVAEAVTADQTIQVLSSTYDVAYKSATSTYTVSLYNNSPAAKLVYNRVDRYEGGGVPYYYLHGVGTIHQNGPWAFDRSSGFYLCQTGRFILGDTSRDAGARVYTYNSQATAELAGKPRIIELPAGSYMNTTGGGWTDKIITAYDNTHIVGEGTILARNHYNSTKFLPELGGNFSVAGGKVLEVDTAIVPTGGGVTSVFPGSIGLFGTGTLLLHGTNTCTGAVRIHDAATLAVTRIGAAGCAAEESCLGTGSEIRFYQNGTLRYVGDTSDGTDRSFTTTNNTSALTLTFANGGKGVFTLNSHQKMLLPTTLGATLRLNAETAPIVFGGSFEAGQTWKMEVAGTKGTSFAVDLGENMPVTVLAGGRLDVSAQNHLPSALDFAGAATIAVAEDFDLVLSAIPPAPQNGASIDFVVPEGSSVTFPGRPNLRLGTVTLNGSPAQTDADGKLVPQGGSGGTAVWTSLVSGGAWSSAANWQDGRLPDVLDTVQVPNADEGAATYTITMDQDAQVDGIVEQEPASGLRTLSGSKTLTLGAGGYTLTPNTTVTKAAGNAAGGPFQLRAPLRFAASQRWLLGSVRSWGAIGARMVSGDFASEPDVEWAPMGYARYVFEAGSSADYLGTTKAGIMFEFYGTNQFHRLGTREIHLYRAELKDDAAVAAGTTRSSPGLMYRFKDAEHAATVVNPIRVTASAYVGNNGSRANWNYDGTPIAFQWANTSTAFTNRATRLTLTGGICGTVAVGYLQFSQSWASQQPMTTFRAFDADFGRIILAGDGTGFTAGSARTYTTLEIAHPSALGPGNARQLDVGADGYWSANYPYTVAGVLVRPGLTYAGNVNAIYRSDSNGAQRRPATMLVGSAETPATAGETVAVFSGQINDNNEDSNELRFTAASGTTAKITGRVLVHANRWKYRGTPDVVARGDVELANVENSFGTNLCVRAGRLVLDANAAGKLPIVLGGYVPRLVEVRCVDGAAAANGTIANVTLSDGTVLYGKKMTFASARTVDGVRVQPGDYVLNVYPGMSGAVGLWKVVSDTEWERPEFLDDVDDVLASRGLRVHVKEGATFGGTAHFLVTDPMHFRKSVQFSEASERLSHSSGVPVFHPDTCANPSVALLTGAATTITNAILVTDNHSTASSTIGGKTAEASTFSGPITLAKSVTLAAADGGTVSFTGRFAGAGDLIGGGAGVSDVTAATIALDETNGFRCASGTLKVTAAQLGSRPLGWIRSTTGEGDGWTETTGVLSVTGDLDLRGRALSYSGFEKDDAHAEKRLLALATCTGTLTLPAEKSVAGSSGRWTLVADGKTLYAKQAPTGVMVIFR